MARYENLPRLESAGLSAERRLLSDFCFVLHFLSDFRRTLPGRDLVGVGSVGSGRSEPNPLLSPQAILLTQLWLILADCDSTAHLISRAGQLSDNPGFPGPSQILI